MHKPSTFHDYIVAISTALFLTLFFGLYLYVRRGFMFDAPAGVDVMYVPNKVLANVGMIIVAFSFLFGPIVRYFNRFDTWLGYRKEIGIIGAFVAFSHGIVSYFFLPKNYPNEYINLTSPEFLSGLLGVFLLFFLFIISFKKAITILGAGRWWFLQRFGLRLAVAFTLIHVYMLKWDSWMKWFTDGIPVSKALALTWLPSANLLAILFVSWVALLRLYESIFLFKNFGLTTKEISMDIILRARGRRFLIGSFCILVILYGIVLTRWLL